MEAFIIYINFLFPIIIKIFIPDGRMGLLTLVTDFLIIPLALLFLNIYLLNTKILLSPYKACAFMLGGLLLGDLVGYLMWGFSSKNLLSPDAETLWIVQRLVIYHIVFSIAFFGIYKFIGLFFVKK